LPGIQAAVGGQAQVIALMVGEVPGALRQRSVGKVSGRADHRHAHVGANAGSDHAFGNVFAQSHARVKAVGGNVDEAVVTTDFHRDVRVFRKEFVEHGPDDHLKHVINGIDADTAGGRVAQV